MAKKKLMSKTEGGEHRKMEKNADFEAIEDVRVNEDDRFTSELERCHLDFKWMTKQTTDFRCSLL